MNKREYAIKILEEKGECVIRCNGKSMLPIIAPNESIHLKKVSHQQLRVGDAVFVRIKSNLQVHLISAIDKDRFQISNNHNFVNGWVGANSIYGLATQIEDRVLVSDEELIKRLPKQTTYFEEQPTSSPAYYFDTPEKKAACWCFCCNFDPTRGWYNPTLHKVIRCPDCGKEKCPKSNHHNGICIGKNNPMLDLNEVLTLIDYATKEFQTLVSARANTPSAGEVLYKLREKIIDIAYNKSK